MFKYYYYDDSFLQFKVACITDWYTIYLSVCFTITQQSDQVNIDKYLWSTMSTEF